MANWGNEISGKFPRLSTSFNSSGWYHWLYHANHPSQCDHFWVDQCDVQNYSHNGLDYEKKPLKKWFGTRRGGTTRQKTQLASDQIPPQLGVSKHGEQLNWWPVQWWKMGQWSSTIKFSGSLWTGTDLVGFMGSVDWHERIWLPMPATSFSSGFF